MRPEIKKLLQKFAEFNALTTASGAVIGGGLGAMTGLIDSAADIGLPARQNAKKQTDVEWSVAEATRLLKNAANMSAGGALVGATVCSVMLWGPPLWSYKAYKSMTAAKEDENQARDRYCPRP